MTKVCNYEMRERHEMKKTTEKQGFTLVELLVVIAILGILMAMMVPAAGLIMKRAKIANTKSDAGVVASVMQKYWMEYNRWPSPYKSSGTGETDSDWVEMMAPKPDTRPKDNFKCIILFESGGGALNAAGAFVDPWGHPFRFRLDLDGSKEMDNPSGSNDKLRLQTLAWSAGPDGDYETWEDNVKSWE